ncbi:MAG: DUF4124 domain-containing protein [Gammaproteobacteria bacterium]
MKHTGQLFLGVILAAGGMLSAAPTAIADSAGIPVYTWTDANGVTHFSDTPRAQGTAKKLLLPVPPPANQTAIAAQRAWVRQLNRNSKKELAQQAAHRRAERQAEATARQNQSERKEVVQYDPFFYPSWYHRRYRHSQRSKLHSDNLPSARFPLNALPSSFTDPLASSFPPGLPSSFPEEQPSPPHQH